MPTYVPNIDLSKVVAIDVHTHVHASVHRDAASRGPSATLEAMGTYFGTDDLGEGTATALAQYYRERNMVAVAFTGDSWGATGEDPSPSNEEVIEIAAANSDVLIPFGSIDPARGKAGAKYAEKLIVEGGVRGFKLHPISQAFYPNDPAIYPFYEVLAAHKIPALFHTGQTGVGAGTPGGGGLKLKYGHPMLLDDVAADFPDMPIVMAHPSFPWQEEALSVATHKPQVYIDLSGWSPKYFAPILVQYANSLLRDKILFGSDYPVITPDRWMRDIDSTALRDDVKPGIYKGNAARLLGLE
jgi:predicted TIM-barrel fold metal-dependent hydrolase